MCIRDRATTCHWARRPLRVAAVVPPSSTSGQACRREIAHSTMTSRTVLLLAMTSLQQVRERCMHLYIQSTGLPFTRRQLLHKLKELGCMSWHQRPYFRARARAKTLLIYRKGEKRGEGLWAWWCKWEGDGRTK